MPKQPKEAKNEEKRGRKPKEKNPNEEVVKPIVASIITASLKVFDKILFETKLWVQATKIPKEPKSTKNTTESIVEPIVSGLVKEAVHQSETGTAKRSKKVKEKTDSGEEKARVFEYMKSQNRPYIINDVHLNLGKSIGKAALVRIMDQLVDENKLFKKVYSKSQVFCINQDLLPGKLIPMRSFAKKHVSATSWRNQTNDWKLERKRRKTQGAEGETSCMQAGKIVPRSDFGTGWKIGEFETWKAATFQLEKWHEFYRWRRSKSKTES